MIKKIIFLDKEKSLQSLNDGFCIVFGEKHREFLTKIGSEILELGIKNGELWCNVLKFKMNNLCVFFEMFDEGEFEKEKIDDILKSLKLFFTDEEIKIIKSNKIDINSEHPSIYMNGERIYSTLIIDTIKIEDVTLKKAIPFDYFKQFKLSKEKQFSSCTLHGEGGLGLDQYSVSSMKYDKEENELFYPIECVSRKYHYLGMLLAKDEILKRWIDIIVNNMKEDTNRYVKGLLRRIIYNLSINSGYADEIILDIQKKQK